MSDEVQGRQTEILQKLAIAVIEATPEHWSEVYLGVEASRPAVDRMQLTHSVWCEQFPEENVTADETIHSLTNELQMLHEANAGPWFQFLFKVMHQEGKWHFSADFSFPQDAPVESAPASTSPAS